MTDDGLALAHYPTTAGVFVGGRKVLELDGVLYELRPIVDRDIKPAKPRGLAAVSPERRAEIGRAGGRATARSEKAVRWTSETARAAGQKGGAAPHRQRGRKVLEPAEATP